jgi:DNA-directed RNA polymerase alpha subunit
VLSGYRQLRAVVAGLVVSALGEVMTPDEHAELDRLRALEKRLGEIFGQPVSDADSLDRIILGCVRQVVASGPAYDLNSSCDVLGASVRARKAFYRLKVKTLGELIRLTPDDLYLQRGFGTSTLREVREKLARLGLHLRQDCFPRLGGWLADGGTGGSPGGP